MNLTNFDYNGKVISQREDGYLNASQMCKVNKKLFADWNRLKATTAYLKEFSQAMGIPIGDLIESKNGVDTWIHPSLAINLARWISPKFAVWCDAHIFNLMTTGKTSLDVDPLAEMRLKLELLKAEKEVAVAQGQIKVAEKNLLDTRHYIATALPEPMQRKVLGYSVVKEEVIKEVVVDSSTGKTHSGVGITYLAKKLGFKNNKQCWSWLENNGYGKNSGRWKNQLTAVNSQKLDYEDVEYLEDLINEQKQGRQLYIGE